MNNSFFAPLNQSVTASFIQQAQLNNAIVCKVTDSNTLEVRRLRVKKTVQFSVFLSLLNKVLLHKENITKIYYQDDEGEWITCTTDEEWEEAKVLSTQAMKYLKVKIQPPTINSIPMNQNPFKNFPAPVRNNFKNNPLFLQNPFNSLPPPVGNNINSPFRSNSNINSFMTNNNNNTNSNGGKLRELVVNNNIPKPFGTNNNAYINNNSNNGNVNNKNNGYEIVDNNNIPKPLPGNNNNGGFKTMNNNNLTFGNNNAFGNGKNNGGFKTVNNNDGGFKPSLPPKQVQHAPSSPTIQKDSQYPIQDLSKVVTSSFTQFNLGGGSAPKPEPKNPEDSELESKIKLLFDMGFTDRERNIKVLREQKGDLQKAVKIFIKS